MTFNVPVKNFKLFSSACLLLLLSGCASNSQTSTQTNTTAKVVSEELPGPIADSAKTNVSGLTLEKIMADPDWIGNAPTSAYWSLDSKTVNYLKKRNGVDFSELWQSDSEVVGSAKLVALEDIHKFRNPNSVFNAERTKAAWLYQNNVFVQDLATGELAQLSRDTQRRTNLQFLTKNRLSYQMHNSFYSLDLETGVSEQLVVWKFQDAPKANKKPADLIAKEQLALISTLRDVRNNRQAEFDHKRALAQNNPSFTKPAFYLSSKLTTVEASLSPDAKWVMLVTQPESKTRDKSDLMPNYVTEDGRIQNHEVRRRIGDAKEVNQTLWLLNLESGTKSKLTYETLPGFNEDVLASVKRENHAVHDIEYEINRLPREIGLMRGGLQGRNPIQWHTKAQQVAIMLEAWDNKDRWIATVDFDSKKLVSQHRLHDPAWINYRFNSFGWLNEQETLYYLSEESGYSHLYLKPIKNGQEALTSGSFEVDKLTLTHDDSFLYFQSNQTHPGIYEVSRVSLTTGEIEQLTNLNGKSTYELSPNDNKLVITHSKLTRPPELYVKDVNTAEAPTQLTNSTTEDFKAVDWVVPQIVTIPSSHTKQPIYARLYLPKDYQGQLNKAVIFNHGAGYLQNAHLGWSGYFREFMFHSLLVQNGYVVLDMDYRASEGYGRDWRTAIYRQMGTPEVEDLQDGVNWLVENVNVDRERVGTYGGSYGGFLTFMAMFNQPELFQAGAALRPVSDWAHYNTGYTSNILNTPDLDPIAFRRSSPIYFAEGLQKPLLINAPMLDSNVFFQDVVRLVQRLIELEKEDFETAIYPLEGHGFKHPSSWLDEYRRIFKLFEENL